MGEEIHIQELREIQLDILDKVHTFCVERNIRYSLGGGTLLGAVRHKGYIPWDDDVDIMLPRPDYDRFLREFDSIYSHLNIQNAFTDPEYVLPFSKIIDNRTVLIERTSDNNTLKSGVYIDVFPVDGLPSEKELYRFCRKLHNWGRAVLYTSPSNTIVGKYPVLKKIYPFFISHEKAVCKMEKFISSFDFENAMFAGAISGRYGQKEHMYADIFRNYSDIDFEDRIYRCISAYDAYLTKHYGDYLKFPPKEMQVRNHNFRAWWKVDLE